MELSYRRISNHAQDRRDFGKLLCGLGVAGVAVAALAYLFGFDPGDVLTIAAQVGRQR